MISWLPVKQHTHQLLPAAGSWGDVMCKDTSAASSGSPGFVLPLIPPDSQAVLCVP